MSIPHRNDEDLEAPTRASARATAVRPKRRGRSEGRIMVCVSPDRYAPAELIAGASLAEEIGAACYMVTVVRPARGPFAWFRAVDHSAMARNSALAETLGVIMVRVMADDPADGVIAFASREGVTHVIAGRGRSSNGLSSPSSMIQRLSRGLRGVEMRVVRSADPASAISGQSLWTKRRATALAVVLFAVLGFSAWAIASAPWPLVATVATAVAAAWCWWLESSTAKKVVKKC
jgi:K+-sensing histidine kinase KdpD